MECAVSDPCIVCKHEYAEHRVDGTGIRCQECPNLKYCFTSGPPQSPALAQPTPPQDSQRNWLLRQMGMLQQETNVANHQAVVTPPPDFVAEPFVPQPCNLCTNLEGGAVRTMHGMTSLCGDCANYADDVERRYAAEKYARRKERIAQ